ncbi:IS630 family transposase [Pseudofrankia sp. BMG5.37]|uniref:IS630 family transposase n=1 Tax=Pseudofrankia sp. BMG5.37 TaxID=3050035 RepID=UPI002894CED8|nr:IS630 family transposase [Pseudofrankia sp. BMG5.37]MDT3443160.1 IS630 family transposase [Pseudofrankia sp. BMG5.37]
MSKEPGSRISRRNLEDTRLLALSAIDKGMHPKDAALAFGAGVSTVYGWLQARNEGGPEALKVKMAPGRTPRLSDEQMSRLWRLVVGRDPRQLRFDFALWTRDLVRELIRREFGVEYTRQGVGRLLHRLGLSPQRPLTRAWEQDHEDVARWKQVDYPKIHAEAQATGASIYFGDEASVRTDFHSGTTWAPVGQTPVVRGTGNRKSVNMISAISAKGKLHFSLLDENTTSATFIEFCGKLLHDVDGPVFLIVDGHGAHKSAATRKYVDSTEGRLKLFYLPAYSPELNPDEWVWKNVKNDNVGKVAARTLDELRDGIKKAFARLLETPDVVRAFFQAPDLAYIEIPVR